MKKITLIISVLFISLGFSQQSTPEALTYTNSNSGSYLAITNVTFNGDPDSINNTTTWARINQAGYGLADNDYTSMKVSLEQGTTSLSYSITGYNDIVGLGYPMDFGILIDFDQNGTYDSSEIVFETAMAASSSTSPFNYTGTLTLPSTLSVSDYNIRVMIGDFNGASYLTGTGSLSYGELEVYTLSVTPSASVCNPPTSGVASNITANSATIGFTAATGNDSFSYTIYSGTDITATPFQSATDATATEISNSALSLSGLSANSEYTVVITASCDGTNAISDLSVNFTTLCDAVTLPYTNSFESGFDCFANTSSTPWLIGTAATTNEGANPTAASDGTNYAYFDDYNYNSGSTADLITPPIDMSSSTTGTLTFDYFDYSATNGSSLSSDTVGVYVVDASGNYNLVLTTEASVSTWTTQAVDISSYVGQIIQIAFRGTSVWGYSSPAIDNISVSEASPCLAPTISSVTASSTTSASVEWTNNTSSSSNDIYLTTSTDLPDSLTAATITGATSPQSLTGLIANTTYYVYVRSQCTAGGTSDWSSASSFTTPCSAFTTGFSQNFNGLSALPSCWEIVNGGSSNTWVFDPTNGFIFLQYNASTHDDYLKSPIFTVSDGLTDGFSFQAQNYSSGYQEQIDIIVEDQTNGTSTIIESAYAPLTVSFESKFYDLSAYEGSDVRISFHSTTTDLYAIFIDNFVVGSASSMSAGWAGFTSTSYSNAQNWYSGSVPTGDVSLNLNSDSASNSPTIGSAVSASSLTVDTGVSLTISESGSLQTTGDFVNNGTVTMNSTATAHSSLIVGGSSTGSITYNRYADIDRWYITSSPVSGQDIDTFISNEDLAVSANNSSLVGLADYNNDGALYPADPTITTGWWDYHQAGDDGTFTSGRGKIVRLASDATDNLLGFTGTINGSVSVPMTVATTAFNLIGNPYPAAVQVTSQGGATNDALSANSSGLSEITAWFWNGADNGYTAVNQNPSQAAKITAPGQGFFVSAAGSGDFSFTPSMQTTSAGSFNRQTEWSKIDLSMSADSQSSETEIVYFDGATTGWDNGYDSTNWSSGSFQIFTSHVDTSTTQNLAIQSLPLGNFNDMVIPVGVNASAGQMITISVDTTNWPEGVKIYLEDVDNSSYTLLDGQNAEFTTLLDSNESGIGRFYIHTTSNSLGDEDLTLTDVSIYASSRDNLRILGINSGEANVQMFDLLGKQVLNTSFNGQSVNDVKLPNLNTGIYLVNLASDEGTVNKKIIIQ